MPNESEPEKKVKIRPRGLDEKEKEPAKPEEAPAVQEEVPEGKKLKWDNRLRQSGIKFPAKLVSKSLEARDGAAQEESVGKAPAQESLATVSEGSGQPEVTPPPTTVAEEGKPVWTKSVEKKPADPALPVRKRVTKRIRLIFAIPAALVAVLVASIISWNFGVGEGMSRSLMEETKEKTTVSKEFLADLDKALADLRGGAPEKAVKELQKLEEDKTGVASLSYLLATAALQSGDLALAEEKTKESILKRERISDSIALQAVIETQKGSDPSIQKFGDPRIRTELLLRQAILADAANPFPLIELATLLRYQKRNDEARDLLRAARSRLNPVDSHSVVDVTLELSTLQDSPDANLPQIADPAKDLAAAFSAAYVALRNGNLDEAVRILKIARNMASPDLFDYLINDPAIRRYVGEPKLREFFQ